MPSFANTRSTSRKVPGCGACTFSSILDAVPVSSVLICSLFILTKLSVFDDVCRSNQVIPVGTGDGLGGCGALCLSSSQHDSVGCGDADVSPLHEDRHKAPTLLHIYPLSLQDEAAFPAITRFDCQRSSDCEQLIRYPNQFYHSPPIIFIAPPPLLPESPAPSSRDSRRRGRAPSSRVLAAWRRLARHATRRDGACCNRSQQAARVECWQAF